MTKFNFIIFPVLFYFWGLSNVNAQYLVVKFQDGSQETKEIGLLQNLKFPDNLLQLSYFSGSTESYDLSTVRTIYLQQFLTAAEDFSLENSSEISVYPNPATQLIYLKNAPETEFLVSIYRMDGTLVLKKQITSQNEAINVGNLTDGLYLIKTNNQALKFIKK